MKRQINILVLRDIITNGTVFYKEGAVSYIFTCPRCDKARKLYIRKSDGVFICFHCADNGFKGNPIYALHELYSIPIKELEERLYGKILQNIGSFTSLKFNDYWGGDGFGYEEEARLIETSWNPNFVGPESPIFKNGEDYLVNTRGILKEHIDHYQIKYNPAWRTVVFPAIANGKLFGWQERGIDKDFKYTLKGFDKKLMLMFQDRLNGSDHAILTEGPVDALKCHGIGGNVCSMGKGVSIPQLDIVKNKVKKLYIGFDPDATVEIDKVCRYMSGEVEVFLMPPHKGRKDHGASTYEEVFEQFKTAKRWHGQIQVYFKNYWK